MNVYAVAVYMAAGLHTMCLLILLKDRPPWWIIPLALPFWPLLVPVALWCVALNYWYDRIRRKQWGGKLPSLLLLLGCLASANATDYGVDGTWYDIGSSHHDEHAAGGFLLGAVGYEAAGLATPSRWRRHTCAVVWTAAVATAYEYHHAAIDRGSLVDPMDIAWTTVGGVAGVVAADYTEQVVTAYITHDSVAIAMVWTF